MDALRGRAKVVGAAADRGRLPRLDVAVSPGDTVALGESVAEVLDVPGHTVGHVAYYFAERGRALLGGQPDGDGLRAAVRGDAGADVGEPEPDGGAAGRDAGLFRARVRGGNARFALSVDGENVALKTRAAEIAAMREKGVPTVPARLDLERATNPFLRARDADFKSRLGLENLPDAQVFAEIRRRKDAF